MSIALNQIRVPLLANQTVDETVSDWVDVRGYKWLTVYVIGTGTTTSGVITIEEADIDPRVFAAGATSTASVCDTVNASTVDGGLQSAIHMDVGAYAYVRTRISTAIGGGGSVSTVLHAAS
jgi:hypothetical protein